MSIFAQLLINSSFATIANFAVWFALTFYIYLESRSVLATSIISAVYLIITSVTSIWFGNLVDRLSKKRLMIYSGLFSSIIFAIGLFIYHFTPKEILTDLSRPVIWVFIILLLVGVIASNIRNIIIPTLVTLLVSEDNRDRANGMVGTASGISFLIVSVVSGFIVAVSGMYLALIIPIVINIITLIHLSFLDIPSNKNNEEISNSEKKLNIREIYRLVKEVPGLMSLIIFTTINNFLGGVFMSLIDAYGLELVSVEVWGVIWGVLSLAFIVGGIYISKKGLGKNPLRSLFMANLSIWIISMTFALQPSILLLSIGMFIYLAIAPFIEASENTIIQKLVSPEKQGRVIGFAHSIEQAASPITSLAIGPLTQLIFIPLMSEGGAGANLIGSWFGIGAGRGIALVFIFAGFLGFILTLIAIRSKFYRNLSRAYLTK